MNQRTLYILILIILGGMTAAGVTPEYQKYANQSKQYNGSDKELYQDIAGKFDGIHVDTLSVFPLECEKLCDGSTECNHWIVVSRNGSIPSIEIESLFPILVYEGDLDGNGTDEFGVLMAANSCWCSYEVKTLYKGKVTNFDSVTWYACNYLEADAGLSTAFSPTDSKGKVKVIYYKMGDGAIQDIGPFTKIKKIKKFLK